MAAMLLVLLAAICASAIDALTVAEFKSREIPAFAMQLQGQELVDYVNKNQPFFRANLSNVSYEKFKSRLMDKKYLKVEGPRAAPIVSNKPIPESFDAREHWKECESLQLVRDQANCGSCWAVSSASAMSDRVCIQTKGKRQTLISDTDILACCGRYCGDGCDGGYTIRAWKYMARKGACTGGPYDTKDVCKPYPFHPCGHHKGKPYYGECLKDNEETPKCRTKCQAGYQTSYANDKIYGRTAYYVENNEEAIQREIMTNGPVQAGFTVYSDFDYYKGGIYVHTAGRDEGGHAIKIVGWGVENGVKYWIIANSWNNDWGENGHFRILRGVNECGIEDMVTAGIMEV